jgi:succinyl-diaminopimelate desuccinylase
MQTPAPVDYARAHSVDEALDLLERYGGEARLIAGGHSLIPMMRLRLAQPECVIDINHRFAPDRGIAEAYAYLQEVFAGYELEIRDQAPGARPGLDQPAAAEFLAVVGKEPAPKFGWTDVARFAELGIPAVNYAPGDPLLAHTDEEYVPVAEIRECERVLAAWLR